MKYQNRILSCVPCLLIQAIVVIPLSSLLVAQDPDEPARVGSYEVKGEGLAVAPAMMGAPTKEKVGGAKQFQLLNLYTIEISRIDSAAKLDDAQKSKLIAAAKELAQQKAQEFARSMDDMMGGGIMPVGGAAPLPSKPKATEPPLKLEEIKSYAEVDVDTQMMLGGGYFPQADHREDADWQKLVKSVLKPEQQAKYEQAIAAQKKVVDKTMVDAGIALLSVDLLLSNDQASKLSALVMEQLANPKPAAPIAENPAMVGVVGGMEGVTFLLELSKVDTKKIRDVLDPQQFELLDLKLENHRRFAAEMSGAVIIVP